MDEKKILFIGYAGASRAYEMFPSSYLYGWQSNTPTVKG
ncbi:hypothetical protein VIAE109791_06130 [Vibrio aestuarianus subsp. francensis]